ncbi:MAG: deoxyribodipyrimidine photo-lyase [Parvibaculum sp.]|nr:deoxyribodipyrimidine photo-lyase [Parvibaculum sp.]
MTTIVWFRHDLRLADNPALLAACRRGGAVIPLFILDAVEPLGGAARWWLHQSLESLGRDCARLGAPLILRRGAPTDVLDQVIAETKADAVYWNRCYEPLRIARDSAIKTNLVSRHIDVQSFNGALLAEPWTVTTMTGNHYKVFTPYWRTLLGHAPFAAPVPAPASLPPAPSPLPSDMLAAWALEPASPDWAQGLRATWVAGEGAAALRLADFLDTDVADYPTARDRMDKDATSRLAPHLHWGEISPRQIWQAASMKADADPAAAQGVAAFQRQLGWRDFSAYLLFHWPHMATRAWKEEYENFPWQNNETHFRRWTKGETGYPVIDAAMRCLWETGTMHNRARMLVASFLIKHLLIDWRRGAEWFEDTLVDADVANNRAGWQWVAGSGADASPYFRIFNPVLQGEKFDPAGTFTRRWVPELAGLDDRFLHKPWCAPARALSEAGIRLGETYPMPLTDHDAARARALGALASMKKNQSTDELEDV